LTNIQHIVLFNSTLILFVLFYRILGFKMEYSRKKQISRQLMDYIIHEQLQEGARLPTIRDMADMFQVSADTVQKAVDILKKEEIIEAKRGHGLFVKSLLPKIKKSRMIGLVFTSESEYLKQYPYPGEIIDTLRNRLKKAGYTLVPYSLKQEGLLTFRKKILSMNIGGLLLFEIEHGFMIREILDLRLPSVSIDFDYSRFGIPTVKFDNTMNAILLTNHLLYEKGHAGVSFLTSSYRQWQGSRAYMDAVCEERKEGYRIAVTLAGLSPHIAGSGSPEDSESGFSQTVVNFLNTRQRPTALVCDSNRLALRFIEEAKRFGCFVPDDISVGGFGPDGMEFTPGKSLTCGYLDLQAMGNTAARYILSSVQGQMPDPLTYILPAKLSEGDSVSGTEAKPGIPSSATGGFSGEKT